MTSTTTDYTRHTTEHQQSLSDAVTAARICDDLRGRDTLVLDLTGITPIFDYFVISTATNRRQLHAMADEVHQSLKQTGSKRIGREGHDSNHWVVQDYGDVVLHVFTPEMRSLYDLENLWGDAPRVDWENSSDSDD